MSASDVLQETVTTARQLAVLVVVPFAMALLRVRDLAAIGADTSTRFSVTFPTPHSFITLWSFVNAPTEAGAGTVSGSLPLVVAAGWGVLFVAALAGYVLVTGIVLAGYLGSIDEGLVDGSFDLAANARRYARPLVVYEAASLLVLLGFVGLLATLQVLLPFVVVGLFVVFYLTYLTPYLVVVTDVGLVVALRRSVALTTSRLDVGVAFIAFATLGAVVSVPISLLAHGNGLVGGVLAAALTAPLGLLASTGFVVFTHELTATTVDAGSE